MQLVAPVGRCSRWRGALHAENMPQSAAAIQRTSAPGHTDIGDECSQLHRHQGRVLPATPMCHLAGMQWRNATQSSPKAMDSLPGVPWY